MQQAQKILVVGGNGFIGSAVCKAALARGMQVTSISTSGRPYQTPKGHTPAWAQKVTWHAASALHPPSYAPLLAGTHAIVHTLGAILPDARYKDALRGGDPFGLVGSALGRLGEELGLSGGGRLEEDGWFEGMNRDSALRVCDAFLASPAPGAGGEGTPRRTFVYISASDVFRPLAPSRYIALKREAERGITAMLAPPDVQTAFRGVYLRPSLVYHAHLRPITAPIAALLDLSASAHASAPPALPTPASILRALSSSPLSPSPTPTNDPGHAPPEADPDSVFASLANALTTPPIHVEHVAEAVCAALADDAVVGPVGVRGMREMIGWAGKGGAENKNTTQRAF